MAQNDELYDEWENDGGGGAPVVSWKGIDPGDALDTFTGILLPPNPLTEPGKGYQPVVDKNKDGNRVWPPEVGYNPPPNVNEKAPISERLYKKITGGDTEDMRYVTITELTLMTQYANGEFFSGPRKKAAREDPEFVDDGLRRIFIDGADLPGKFKEAVKRLRSRGPQVGQRLTIQLVNREANVGKEGEKKIFKVTLEAPTPETMAIVQAFIAEAKSADENAGAVDEWASATPAAEEVAPPF